MRVSMLRVPHGLWAGGGGLEHVRALLHTFLLWFSCWRVLERCVCLELRAQAAGLVCLWESHV